MTCGHHDTPMRFCPYCGEALPCGQEQEPSEDGLTILVLGPEGRGPKPRRPAEIPDRLGLMGPAPKDMGSFTDRVAKRIRRTVSGKE